MKPPMLLKTRIGRRLLLVSLAIALVPLVTMVWIAVSRGEAEIHRQTLAVLRAATDGAEAQLREFLASLKSRTVSISLDDLVRGALETAGSRQTPTAPALPPVARLSSHLAQRQQHFPEATEIAVIDLQGRIIGSSAETSVGRDDARMNYFLQGRQAVFVSDLFRDTRTGTIEWVVAAPVTKRDSDEIIGVLACWIDPRVLSDVTTGRRIVAMGADTHVFQIGDTGETFIVNRNKRMITESRFIPHAVLDVTVDTEPVRVALERQQEVSGDYVDYRGQRVSGASTLMPETGWVVVTEIDFGQAFVPLKKLRNVLLALSAGLGLVIVCLAWGFTRTIIQPIQVLNQADVALGRGDPAAAFVPEEQIPNDEIGDAMRNRNRMLRSMLVHQRQLALEQQHRAERLNQMLQQSLTFSRTIFWRLPLADLQGGVAHAWSKAELFGNLEEVLGYPAKAFHAHPDLWKDHIHAEDFPELERLAGQLTQEGGAVSCLYRFRHARGQWVWLQQQMSMVRSEANPTCALHGIATEVSGFMQAQQALQTAQDQLRQYADKLEQMVADRTANLQETIQSLEGVCYHIAHDLRSPVRAIEGFTKILLQQYAPAWDGTGQDFAGRIVKAATRMDQLITDLLEYGQLGHATLPASHIDLEAAIREALAHFAPDIQAKQAEIRVDSPLPAIWANATVVQQILTNLLSNALKFVAPGVAPRVHLWAQPSNGVVRLWVRDNGIGIAPEYQERVFRIFERLHHTEVYPGTGIGLAIVAKGAQRLGGAVGVQSQPGAGSRFWVEFPAAPEGKA